MTLGAPAWSTQPEEESAAWIDTGLEAIRESGMSVIVGIVPAAGETPLFAGFGRFEEDRIAPADTQVDLLSITKSVTAAAVMKLVERGDLRLDETLGEILAGVPADKSGITVHQLLTHTAGFSSLSGDDFEPVSLDEVLDRLFRTPLVHEPGETYSYSNPGYTLLAAIVGLRSEAGGYEAFLREWLAPHGIDSIGYESVYEADRAARSTRGRPVAEESWGGDRPYWNLRGNGGLIATAEDFLAFRRLLAEGRLLDPELTGLIVTPHVREIAGRESFYGYGVVVENPDGGRAYTHNGGGRFYSSEWFEDPETGTVLFTAGLFEPEGNAFRAMRVLREHYRSHQP